MDVPARRELSIKAVRAALRFDSFAVNQVWNENGVRWVRAQAIWQQKKRFHVAWSLREFVDELMLNPGSIRVYRDELDTWLALA